MQRKWQNVFQLRFAAAKQKYCNKWMNGINTVSLRWYFIKSSKQYGAYRGCSTRIECVAYGEIPYFNIKFNGGGGDVKSISCFIFRHSSNQKNRDISAYLKIECIFIVDGWFEWCFMLSTRSMEKKREYSRRMFEMIYPFQWVDGTHMCAMCVSAICTNFVGLFQKWIGFRFVNFLPHEISKEEVEQKKCRLLN